MAAFHSKWSIWTLTTSTEPRQTTVSISLVKAKSIDSMPVTTTALSIHRGYQSSLMMTSIHKASRLLTQLAKPPITVVSSIKASRVTGTGSGNSNHNIVVFDTEYSWLPGYNQYSWGSSGSCSTIGTVISLSFASVWFSRHLVNNRKHRLCSLRLRLERRFRRRCSQRLVRMRSLLLPKPQQQLFGLHWSHWTAILYSIGRHRQDRSPIRRQYWFDRNSWYQLSVKWLNDVSFFTATPSSATSSGGTQDPKKAFIYVGSTNNELVQVTLPLTDRTADVSKTSISITTGHED